MWRFKASKFKNAAPKMPKKEEWISEVSAANLMQSCGNHIRASTAYMAFNSDTGGGGNLGVLPLSTHGRQPVGSIPMVRAHAEYVTDFAFSPFDDYSLATTSPDGTVKIWSLPKTDEEFHLNNATATLHVGEKRVEALRWHPTVADIIMTAMDNTLTVHNTSTQQPIAVIGDHGDVIHSCSWRGDGSALVTSCKDKKLRVLDPRARSTVTECSGHDNMRDSRVVWLGNKDLILSSAFDSSRMREVCVRDCRNMSTTICTKSFDSSSGVLMPLYDADTGMLFLAGVGDTSLRYMEITDKDIVANSTDTVEQVKGLCLVPKRAMDVMNCEVNRLLLLGQHVIIPVPYQVPRKSMEEFHSDLFPETACGDPALTLKQWLDGENTNVSKMSLNPRTSSVRTVHGAEFGQNKTPSKPESDHNAPSKPEQPSLQENKPIRSMPDVVPQVSNTPSPAPPEPLPPKPSVIMRQKKNIFSGVRQSKFRHLEGVALHKSQNIENIRNLSTRTPGESDMFVANSKFCALPLGGSAGLVAVLKISCPGRLPDTGIPALQHGSLVGDFTWDPFDNHKLAVGCDDAKIRLWQIPDDGATELMTKPDQCLTGHMEKIYFLRYHPLASGVLASGSYDMTVRIWDVASGAERIQLLGHTDTIMCFSWSPDGVHCVTVCKDGVIRLYDPRTSAQPIKTSMAVPDTHGARVVWACGGSLLLIVGFEKSSLRSVRVYNPGDMALLYNLELNTSPTILVAHYDEDSSTLFLTGRGENTVLTFEVAEEEPYLFPLSPHKTDGLHQALAFLPKTQCDVAKVQFARALRLTSNAVEPIAYTVPRVKTNYFQDDLFPMTKVTWEPALSSSDWFDGGNKQQRMISLRPENMDLLSTAPVEAPKPKKYESFNPEVYKSDEQKKEELLNAMLGKFEVSEGPLPQDLTEGVDEDEWDDY